MCRTRETAFASIKHGGGSVTAWSHVAANETRLYVIWSYAVEASSVKTGIVDFIQIFIISHVTNHAAV